MSDREEKTGKNDNGKKNKGGKRNKIIAIASNNITNTESRKTIIL